MGLVREYYIPISPMVAGHGPWFLEGLTKQVTLSLLDVTRLTFRRFVSPLRFGSALSGKPHYREGQGNLFPFALNASPNGVSLPPPVALSWHCPQAFPVSLANLAVASAGREMTRLAVPAIKISVAVLKKTATSAFLAFIFIVVSGLWTRLVQSPQAEPLRANVRPGQTKHKPRAEARSVRSRTSRASS